MIPIIAPVRFFSDISRIKNHIHMNTGKALLAVLAAAAAGGAVRMLFAPHKGSETRKKIARTKDDVVDSLEKTIDSLKRKFSPKRTTQEAEPASTGAHGMN